MAPWSYIKREINSRKYGYIVAWYIPPLLCSERMGDYHQELSHKGNTIARNERFLNRVITCHFYSSNLSLAWLKISSGLPSWNTRNCFVRSLVITKQDILREKIYFTRNSNQEMLWDIQNPNLDGESFMKLEIIITNSNWGSLLQVIEIVADAAKLTEVCHHTVGTETRTACLPHMVTENFQTEIIKVNKITQPRYWYTSFAEHRLTTQTTCAISSQSKEKLWL